MRKRILSRVCLSVCFGLLLMAGNAFAQQAERADQILRIRRMPRLGRQMLERTPAFDVRGAGAVRNPRNWAHILLELETAPEWIDELSFTYYLMTQVRGETAFSLFQTTVRYGDIPRGQHQSSVLLMPAAVERFGEPIALGVEISYDGQVVATESASTLPALEGEWWRNERVVDSPNVTRREGYLLDRSQTPFALVNWDDFLVVR